MNDTANSVYRSGVVSTCYESARDESSLPCASGFHPTEPLPNPAEDRAASCPEERRTPSWAAQSNLSVRAGKALVEEAICPAHREF